ALELAEGRISRFERDRGENQIAFQFDPRLFERTHRHHESAELRFIVDHAFAEKHVPDNPRGFQLDFIFAGIGAELWTGVHMSIPDQTLAIRRPWDRRNRVDTLFGDKLQFSFDAVAPQPFENVLAEFSFISMRATSVANL